MLEPEEYCTPKTKWTAPHLWVMFTNDYPTGCAATTATRHHKQGKGPAYVRARHAIASHQHTDCKSPVC